MLALRGPYSDTCVGVRLTARGPSRTASVHPAGHGVWRCHACGPAVPTEPAWSLGRLFFCFHSQNRIPARQPQESVRAVSHNHGHDADAKVGQRFQALFESRSHRRTVRSQEPEMHEAHTVIDITFPTKRAGQRPTSKSCRPCPRLPHGRLASPGLHSRTRWTPCLFSEKNVVIGQHEFDL